ncbi:hypothetical protein K493DRAFT_310396 [Basidiobolus meristosporus CBS 931.73]|uniref:Mediator of RNA polymerase II transcription subunit 4 n=1 Tax=Basidiobolus meristosporus CBS 931.73 TaxID=1314790 RepID=A0A1Y1ZAG7_9FUNG|nr:hypothetical protein K493DRAFT_310396 [Basidiobolus meristosporus CBS 931.73]|eukprot:ORY06795.1 hypothetical protein K493DRAFT_310396 [Basidiobolus meristosporus CBS 931.73]
MSKELSLKQLVGGIIEEYSQLLGTLFRSIDLALEGKLVAGQKTPQETIRAIILLDTKLQKAYDEVEEHQSYQRRITQVEDEIYEYKQAIRELVEKLESTKESLESMIDHSEKALKTLNQAKESKLSFKDIISYSNRLSAFTAAPPNYNPNNTFIPVEPPYPVEVTMRAGALSLHHTKGVEADVASEESEDEQPSYQAFSFLAQQEEEEAAESNDFLLDLDLNPDLE